MKSITKRLSKLRPGHKFTIENCTFERLKDPIYYRVNYFGIDPGTGKYEESYSYGSPHISDVVNDYNHYQLNQ